LTIRCNNTHIFLNKYKQGDCYVAVTGLPDPRKDHAVAMCRFARECLIKTRVLVRKLEIRLGPDTADLAMRMGIHSGPVTAGVLRGERSRFQLFGDTMNTAARMEHTGIRDRIQLSQETTDLLIAAGKTNWISRREDLVHAKGKFVVVVCVISCVQGFLINNACHSM
jgi:class 3 adenylate cyclase